MGNRTNKKNLTKTEKEKIKNLIRECELLRLTSDEILEYLEEKGFVVCKTTMNKLKKELREELGDKLENFGRHEFLYEHFLAIQMLKDLQKELLRIIKDPKTSESEKVKISSEIRSLIRDIFDFYGSKDLVESVFKYFEENYPVP